MNRCSQHRQGSLGGVAAEVKEATLKWMLRGRFDDM
jgi:hypothetical protein